MKKTIILATILTLLFIPIFSIYSQTKVYDNETVYVLSDPYGNFKDKIVVDWIRVRGSGDYEIKDPIDELVDVKKIYGEGEIEIKDNYAIVKGESSGIQDTYYRGNYIKELPFEISVKYYLNGKEEKLENITGKNGKLRVEISGKSKMIKDSKIVPLLMTISTSIDVESVKDISLSGDTKPVISGLKYLINLITILDSEGSSYFEFESDKIDIPELMISISPTYPSVEIPSIKVFDELYNGLDGLANLTKIQKDFLDELIKNSEANISKMDLNKLKEGIENLNLISLGIDAHRDSLLMISNNIDEEKLKLLKSIPSNLDPIISSLQVSNSNLSNLIQILDVYTKIIKDIGNINKVNQDILTNIDPSLKAKLLENLKNEEYLIKILIDGGTLPDGTTILSIPQLKDALQKIRDGNEMILISLNLFKEALNPVSQIADINIELKKNLNIITNGGEMNGQKVYGLNDLSNSLKEGVKTFSLAISTLNNELKNSFSQLLETLKILSSGGKVLNRNFPGLNFTVDSISKMKDGVKIGKDEYEKSRNEILEKKKLTDSVDTFIGKPINSESRVQFIIKLSK